MSSIIDFKSMGIDADSFRNRSTGTAIPYTCLVEYDRNMSFEGNIVDAAVLVLNGEVVLKHTSTFETGDFSKVLDITNQVVPGKLNTLEFRTNIYDMTVMGVEVTTSSVVKLKQGRKVLAAVAYRTSRPTMYRTATEVWHFVA